MHPNDGRVVSNFICQAIKGDDITIYGNGNQTRSFCYIDDLIGSIVKIMNTPNITGPINIGNPQEITIIELAKKILDLTNSKSNIIFKKLPEDDPKVRCPDISLAKIIIDWEPKSTLDEGLTKTIRYFRSLLN